MALTIEITSEKLVYALCDANRAPKEVQSLCHVINAVELGTGCQEFNNDQEVYDACISLLDLSTGGNCGSLKGKGSVTTYLICNEIYSGLNADTCESKEQGSSSPRGLSPQENQSVDAIVPFDVRQAMCEFGHYIRKNHPFITEARNSAILGRAMDSGIESAFIETSHASNPIEARIESLSQIFTKLGESTSPTFASQDTRNRAKNLGIKVLLKLQQSKKESISTHDLAIFLKQLIKIVDKNRQHWAAEASQVGTDITIDVGEEVAGDIAPCSIQISANGKVNVHLGSILINKKPRSLGAIGVGALKKVSLSFDYDLASQNPLKGETDSSFSASAYLVKKPISGHDENLEREVRIQKRFEGMTGIAPAGAIVSLSSNKNPSTKSLVASQKYFPLDLLKFARHLAGNEFETVEGFSKDQIRIDLAVELLEGLSTLHHAGVHHRDIKPANILISYDDKRLPHAHIADFGEAYDLVNPDENKNLKLFGGTVAYMSPEYIRGGGKPLGNQNLKNDVWAMGLVLYNLEHGKEADFFKDGEANTMALMYKIAKKLLDYPSLGEVLGIHFDPNNPPLQSTYEYVLFRMLDPDVTHRVTSEEALKLMKVVQKHSQGMSPSPMRFHLKVLTHLARRYSWTKIEGSLVSPESTGIQKIQHQIESRFKTETDKYRKVFKEDKLASTASSNSDSFNSDTASSQFTDSSKNSNKSIPRSPSVADPLRGTVR